ncbi:MAG: CvpA family protein [Lachnospiraceae bacterium]|nr:CvpA family protein [Lachnospiraceae bacterium]
MKSRIIFIVGVLLAAAIYYYITIPAINIHSTGMWAFMIGLVLMIGCAIAIRVAKKKGNVRLTRNGLDISPGDIGIAKYIFYFCGALVVIFVIGSILSSPIVNAKRYQQLMDVEEREFATDIKEVDFNTIPLLDRDSASILGNRKMGSMVDMVSQFEVADDYTQINYNDTPVRVTPLRYANTIKWLTNQKDGIPAYIRIDMATQDAECVKLSEGIKYSHSEYFNRYIFRHLRFRYPTYIFADQIFFEIDDEGTPFWICPVKKFNIGLFGGQTIGRVVICNAITGECVDYAVEDVPQWVDKVYQAELLIQLYDYHGTLKRGYFNSILGQKDCLQTTNGYNYIAMDDDVWVYSGVTSVSGDQSNVGFVLMNQRTMETRFYKIEGAIEDSAMSSAEGQVQNLGYQATFPLLLNISGEPTYFMALKDGAGLVKKYAMVNIQKYQWVAIGDTVKECRKEYNKLLSTNGIRSSENKDSKEATGVIRTYATVVIDNASRVYFTIEGYDEIFDVDLSMEDTLDIIKFKEGDTISVSYMEGDVLSTVTEVK